MDQFYNIIEAIKNSFLGNGFTNTVTFGDITDIDLSKQTIFPLAHTIVGNAIYKDQTWELSISILCMDIVDQTKDEVTDQFRGNNNLQDILNTQMNLIGIFLDDFKKGTNYGNAYHLINEPVLEPFMDRFENQLAGWSLTMDVAIKNTICA